MTGPSILHHVLRVGPKIHRSELHSWTGAGPKHGNCRCEGIGTRDRYQLPWLIVYQGRGGPRGPRIGRTVSGGAARSSWERANRVEKRRSARAGRRGHEEAEKGEL